MAGLSRFILFAVARLLVGANSGPTIIPNPDGSDAIVIPADSPVTFIRFNGPSAAEFAGKFQLSGSFSVDCEEICADAGEASISSLRLQIVVYPDSAVEALLPHWKSQRNSMRIRLSKSTVVARMLVPRRDGLRYSDFETIRGRITVVADQYSTSLDCDSANYHARLIEVAKAPKVAKVELEGEYGCG